MTNEHETSKGGDLPRLVYIGGYGRSGSTLLDIVLGDHPDLVSVGALHNLPAWREDDLPCACGKPFSLCPFWSAVREKAGSIVVTDQDQRAIEGRSVLVRRLWGHRDIQLDERYTRSQRELWSALRQVSGAEAVVDSSKSAGETLGRPLALGRMVGLDVTVVHLARHPLGVLRSISSGAGGSHRPWRRRNPLYLVTKTAFQWSFTNISCLLLYRGKNVVRLTLEEFLADPVEALGRVGEAIGCDLSWQAGGVVDGRPFVPGHNLGGNRVKEQSEVIVSRSVVERQTPRNAWEGLYLVLTAPAYLFLRGWFRW